MDEITMGELLGRRRLHKTPRGLYQPGQHGAVIIGDKAILSWVDNSGYLCIMPCEFTDDEWIGSQFIVRCGFQTVDSRNLGRKRDLDGDQVNAIKRAQKGKKKGAAAQATTPSSSPASEES